MNLTTKSFTFLKREKTNDIHKNIQRNVKISNMTKHVARIKFFTTFMFRTLAELSSLTKGWRSMRDSLVTLNNDKCHKHIPELKFTGPCIILIVE
jgi:hypothetical protein